MMHSTITYSSASIPMESASRTGRGAAGGALRTLRDTVSLLLDSRRTVLAVSSVALLPLLLVFLVSHPHVTLLLRSMIAGLRLLAALGPISPRFEPIAAAVLDNALQFAALEAAAGFAALAVSAALMAAVVNILAAAGYGQELTAGEVLAKLGQSWKRALATELTATFLRFCYSSVVVLLLLSLAAATSGDSLPLLAAAATACLLLAAHVESVLHMASTVAVLEKEHCGFSALGRAAELVGVMGWEALGLSLLLLPAGAVVAAGLYVVKGEGLWFGAAETCACVAVSVVVYGAWAVFYLRCMERRAMEDDWEKLGDETLNFPTRTGALSDDNV